MQCNAVNTQDRGLCHQLMFVMRYRCCCFRCRLRIAVKSISHHGCSEVCPSQVVSVVILHTDLQKAMLGFACFQHQCMSKIRCKQQGSVYGKLGMPKGASGQRPENSFSPLSNSDDYLHTALPLTRASLPTLLQPKPASLTSVWSNVCRQGQPSIPI